MESTIPQTVRLEAFCPPSCWSISCDGMVQHPFQGMAQAVTTTRCETSGRGESSLCAHDHTAKVDMCFSRLLLKLYAAEDCHHLGSSICEEFSSHKSKNNSQQQLSTQGLCNAETYWLMFSQECFKKEIQAIKIG